MMRICALLSWCWGCLAVTFLVLSVLAVSEQRALADAGSDCANNCVMYYGTPYYDTCMAGCCSSKCGTDQTCLQQCQAGQPCYNNCANGCKGVMPPDCKGAGGCNAKAGCNCKCWEEDAKKCNCY